jgi:DNA-binding response OmpR family regulator
VQDNWRSHSDSVLIKPLGTKEFLRQVESILARHAERSYSDDADSIRKKAFPKAQGGKRHAR